MIQAIGADHVILLKSSLPTYIVYVQHKYSQVFSLCLSIASLVNYIQLISGLQFVNRNTSVNAIYKLSSISLANAWLEN